MILEIDIDYEAKKITVRGKHNHSYNANGNTPLKWKAKGGKGHKNWTVSFRNQDNSPFDDGKWEFGDKGPGADGGQLISCGDPKGERFPYDVTCTDKHDKTFNSDPEVVLWPD